MAAFHLLLRFPVEYIGKSSRTEYIKRALATDVAVTLSTNDDVSFHVVLRTFVVRIVKETGANEVFVSIAELHFVKTSSEYSWVDKCCRHP